MSALFGILQLDRGEPWGYGQLAALTQAWLQDAGGFAAIGLAVYIYYALSRPTDQSQSEKIRVPVTRWMVSVGALALMCYAVYFVMVATGRGAAPEPPPPDPSVLPRPELPRYHPEPQPVVLMVAGLLAILAVGEPFARDLVRIARRNVSFGTAGLVRFGGTLRTYAADLLSPGRVAVLVGALVAYALVGAALFAVGVPQLTAIWTQALAVGVGVAVCALLLLMLFEAEGPMWAIAKLSFKEAVRSQVLWIFLLGMLPFLFPLQGLFTGNTKPSDEMRATTSFVTVVLSFLALVPAVLIASFGIPNDIKNLNIFTVVSKPVERFEIVLGRFVGYTALMTLVMLALAGVSLVLIGNSNASDKARAETYTARVPYRGKLEFRSLAAQERRDQREFGGTNVGREFDYRRYITGSPGSVHRAIWKFDAPPGDLADAPGDRVPVEFTFDIFKLTKGTQNRGAMTKFQVVTHAAPLRRPTLREISKDDAEWPWVNGADREDYLAAVARLSSGVLIDEPLAAAARAGGPGAAGKARLAGRMKSLAERLKKQGVAVTEGENGRVTTDPANVREPRAGGPSWKAVNALAEEFGFFEVPGKEVFDYQVMGIDVPAGLIRNALAGDPGKDPETGAPLPRLSVYVKCEDEGQMLGAAEPDLYLLRTEIPYPVNFLKATIGLWCRLCIVIGVAVALSTYLSGVLSLLLTALLYLIGFFTDYLSELAKGTNIGGGPVQTISQLVRAEQPTTPLADGASTKVILFADRSWQWLIRRLQNMIPDVDSFSWGNFVSEGFNVSPEYLVLNVLVAFGYLLPWAVLAYYLMKSREVAA